MIFSSGVGGVEIGDDGDDGGEREREGEGDMGEEREE